MPDVKLAFDRKSARSFDADGRMRVKDCILSTAEVNLYRGQEIPGWEKLGLKPNTVYELYRDPDELKKAVATFEGIPLMLKHIPQTAEAPRKEYQAGSVHTIRFDGKHLRGDLLVTDGYAIELIQSDEMSDLSCGYRYDPVMQSGEADGSKYDGCMWNIQGNHVALVDDGRATGAHVADSAMRENPQTPDPSMQGVDAMPFGEENKEQPGANAAPAGNAPPAGSPEGEMNEQNNMAAIGQALKHIAGLLENIHARLPGGDTSGADRHDGVDGYDNEMEGEACDSEGGEPTGEVPPKLEEHEGASIELSKATEGHEGAFDEDGPPLPNEQEGTPARGGYTPIAAMDSRTVRRMIDKEVSAAVEGERKRAQRVEQAKRDTRGVLGEVYGMDSAGKIYREALKQVGMDVASISKGNEKAAWDAYKLAAGHAAGARPKAQMAMDGKSDAPAWLGALNKISVKG